MDVTRITGLASGFDTEGTIKKLMTAQRIPQDKLKQQKQVLEWQRADYRSMSTSLSALRDKLTTMKLQSTFLAKKIESTDSSVVTGTATVDAVNNSSITISNISALAAGAKLESTATISGGTAIDKTAALTTQTFAGGSPSGTINFTITAAQADGTTKSQAFSYDLSGTDSSKTLQDVMNDVNNAGLGVAMMYDSTLDKVVLQNKNTGDLVTGANNDLTITGDNFMGTYLNLGAAADGQDASFDLNGNGNTITSHTNTPTVYGIKLSLNKTDTTGTEFTLGVKADADAVVQTIKDFLTQYNTTLSTLTDKVNETRYRDYPPLTDDQRSSLSDTDIKNWEDKAKSGLLRNDSVLSLAIDNLRRDAYSPVSGTSSSTLNQLSAIGISATDYSDNGKLTIVDETKLREKIEEDPDAVMQMFTNTSTDSSKQGIAVRMYNNINTAMDNIYTTAGNTSSTSSQDSSTIGKTLRDVDTQILDWTVKLTDIENAYYNKFTAMEKAINDMNAKSAQLTSSLGG